MPDDVQPVAAVAASPVEDVLLELRDPHRHRFESTRQVTATATLIYIPADTTTRRLESHRFTSTAPLGPIEVDNCAGIRSVLEKPAGHWPCRILEVGL